jgi:hypothetical protein
VFYFFFFLSLSLSLCHIEDLLLLSISSSRFFIVIVVFVVVVVILGAIFDGAIETLSHKTIAASHRLSSAKLATVGAFVPIRLMTIQQLLRAKLEFAQITNQNTIISFVLEREWRLRKMQRECLFPSLNCTLSSAAASALTQQGLHKPVSRPFTEIFDSASLMPQSSH